MTTSTVRQNLIASGAAPMNFTNLEFFQAFRDRDLDKVHQIIESGFDVNFTDPAKHNRDQTMLHLAADHGFVKLMRSLISAGAELNPRDIYGNTPLHIAVKHEHWEATKILVYAGADVNCQNDGDVSPLHLLAESESDDIDSGYFDPFLLTLLDHGACINIRDNSYRTPLHNAMISNNMEVAYFLLENNADNTVRDIFGKLACDYNNPITEYVYNNIKPS